MARDRKLTWKMVKEQPWIGVDLEPVDWDPTPELSNAIDKGGVKGGIKHLQRKIGRIVK